MKILMVTRNILDGTGMTVKNLVWQLEKHPFIEKITLIAPSKFSTFSKKVKFIIIKNKGKYFFIKEPYFAYQAYKAIKKETNINNYDIIHLHSNILSYKFSKKNPFVSTFHTTHHHIFKSIKLSQFKYKYGKYLHLPLIYLDKKRVKNSDKIVCVSTATIKSLQEKNNKNKFKYIPNAVDTTLFKPINKKVNKIDYFQKKYKIDVRGKSVLFFIGRLESGKGVTHLAQVIQKLPKTILILAGVGPERKVLEKFPRVHCLGYINDQQEKNRLLNYADLFVFASLYENFPLVIPEAMAVKKPIISTKVGMVSLLLGKRERVLVDPLDMNDFYLKTKSILESPSFMKEEAQLNYKYAVKNLSWKNVMQQYLAIYKIVTDKK